ncbi:MAG TPA: hypothetical protein VFC38_05625 [Stellaceae bacterium]|nr:hypothetical protein [Stellaceae bacterium]
MATSRILQFPDLRKPEKLLVDTAMLEPLFAYKREDPNQLMAIAKMATRANDAYLDRPRNRPEARSEQAKANAAAMGFIAFGMLLGFEFDDIVSFVQK